MSVTGRNGHTIRVTGERRNDRHELRVGPWVRGRLLLFDLGYFGYRLFDRIRRNEGFFISRMKSNSNPLIVRAHRRWRGRAVRVLGKPLQEVLGKLTREVLDVDIEVQFQRRAYRGTASRPTTAFRFVAVRDDTTGAYHTYVTNVPPERLSAEEVARAYAARWEVELLFRAWKSEFRLDELPSRRKEVVEALVYASIATMLLTNRLLAYLRAKAGHDARRVTLRRVAAALRHFAGDLLIMVAGKGQHADATHVVRLLAEEAMDPHLNRRYLLERASASDPKVA
jgi:IS4 transposase